MNDMVTEHRNLCVQIVLLKAAYVQTRCDKPSDYVAELWEEIDGLIRELTEKRDFLFKKMLGTEEAV